ncbi:MAG: hypothetical protein KJ911_15540 [Alphaproteobacteria bacterium]|jgi:hypothetical protein|uniref:Uncharacterized protein n=1 Tax=Brevundimonas mediterranea TaxID=74329 RepID=A0A7Z9C6G6_9CAUL|nr:MULTISPECIES: hypothetical protein [Brevundimonas]MBU4198152.1 hypothetical protein [Alphaproteobacteria bacterium]MCG2665114.1 hypothetical protein [Brevundimonas sp.]VDC50987.1 hypothetical protein BREV_BREV_02416 [Brevundimonas mediterranea]
MGNPIETLRTEGGVIAQAPWSFVLCLFVVAGVLFLIIRSLKVQEVADLNSRLTLRNDEIADYRRKLDGASPDEAKARLDELEAQVARLQPRRFDAAQRELIRAAVANQPALVSIAADMAAGDARGLVADLSGAFQGAGWSVSNPMVGGLGNPPPSGLGINVADPENLTDPQARFVRALQEIGAEFDLRRGVMRDMPGHAAPEIEILVTTAVR